MRTRILITSLLAVLTLAGCASSRSGDVYSREQTRREMSVRMGVIESVREVQMEGTKSGVGSTAGAVVGGVAGSNIGGGKGQIVGAVVGAVLGGLAGHGIEDATNKKQAMELTIKLDSGQVIAIVQEGDPMAFRTGDRVRVLSGSGETRVTH
ncbi:MAG: hypothetical protein RIR00_904 [Pseudomonadota bacterium]|jgi:outer membrane lipoprotein SlyB